MEALGFVGLTPSPLYNIIEKQKRGMVKMKRNAMQRMASLALALLRKERLWLPLRDMAAVWGSGLLGIALGQLLGAGLIVSSVLIPAKRSG